jgi:hypothetical protein
MSDEFASWTENLRPRSQEGQVGLSSKARDIERNLGF